MKLSVLDTVPLSTGETSAEALAASMRLVELADELGYHRYWYAEHHNMRTIAATSPPVLIAAASSRTRHIRLGSGGVMLPNHSPLVVAEQFAALEGLAPGRIDLGIGRAPGSDPVVSHFLRQSGPTSSVEDFPQAVSGVLALVRPEGASLVLGQGRQYQVRATGNAASTPQVWLLGSSDYSAELAARMGLPYVFANHFSGHGLERALDIYRSQFRASEELDQPQTFVPVNVSVAADASEAEERALPFLRTFGRLRLGLPIPATETLEEIAAGPKNDALDRAVSEVRSSWEIGTADQVAGRLRHLAKSLDVDEIMVVPNSASYEQEASGHGRASAVSLLAHEIWG